MKIINKFRVLMSALAITTVASFAGAISGSIAWFAYSTRATLSYQGTSVENTVLLQVGLVCDTQYWSTPEELEQIKEDYGLVYEYVKGKHIYFGKGGGGLKSDAINAYLAKTGYAINELEPITSSKYTMDILGAPGNYLNLYKAPTYSKFRKNSENGAAEIAQYSRIRFAFRVLHGDGSGNPNQKIWLTHSVAEASTVDDGNISQAIRVFFDGTESSGKRFIYNPSKTESGYVNVAGLLNLDKDNEYYDSDSTGVEGIYGDYTGVSLLPTYIADDTGLVDMNDTGTRATHTTFYAKHQGAHTVYNYDKTTFLNGIKPDKAEYLGLNDIAPNTDFSTGLSLCTTSNDEDAVGFLDIKIWIEGWDHSVIDEEINHKFNLGLQFEIQRT